MLLTEFDEELHDKATYDAGFADGEARGKAIGEARGEAKGEARGQALGETRGRITALAGLVVNGLLSLEDAVLQAGLNEEEFIQQAKQFNIFIKQ